MNKEYMIHIKFDTEYFNEEKDIFRKFIGTEAELSTKLVDYIKHKIAEICCQLNIESINLEHLYFGIERHTKFYDFSNALFEEEILLDNCKSFFASVEVICLSDIVDLEEVNAEW